MHTSVRRPPALPQGHTRSGWRLGGFDSRVKEVLLLNPGIYLPVHILEQEALTYNAFIKIPLGKITCGCRLGG